MPKLIELNDEVFEKLMKKKEIELQRQKEYEEWKRKKDIEKRKEDINDYFTIENMIKDKKFEDTKKIERLLLKLKDFIYKENLTYILNEDKRNKLFSY